MMHSRRIQKIPIHTGDSVNLVTRVSRIKPIVILVICMAVLLGNTAAGVIPGGIPQDIPVLSPTGYNTSGMNTVMHRSIQLGNGIYQTVPSQEETQYRYIMIPPDQQNGYEQKIPDTPGDSGTGQGQGYAQRPARQNPPQGTEPVQEWSENPQRDFRENQEPDVANPIPSPGFYSENPQGTGDISNRPVNDPARQYEEPVPVTSATCHSPLVQTAIPDGIYEPGYRCYGNENDNSLKYRPDTGIIQVHSYPTRASVFLNGIYRGITPSSGYLQVTGLLPGTYTIRIEYDGYQDYLATIGVYCGEVSSLYAEMSPAGVTGEGTTTPDPKVLHAILSVTSEPAGADIFLDNRYMGITPVILRGEEPGVYSIILKKEGYTSYQGTVTMEPDTNTLFSAVLVPVISQSSPAGTIADAGGETPLPQSTRAGLSLVVICASLAGGSLYLKRKRYAQENLEER